MPRLSPAADLAAVLREKDSPMRLTTLAAAVDLGPDLRDRTESKSDKGDLVLLSRGSGGKDSPQVATRLSQTDTVSTWSVASGGRMGGVLGEDAVELSAGATSCVQDCQAQNRIRGSLQVTDPAFSG
jgi:hypothetical protein